MEETRFEHRSVLLREAVEQLQVRPSGIYVDGTLGKGGHSKEILKRLTNGRLIGIDQDENAIRAATENLRELSEKLTVVKDNFSNIKKILQALNIEKIDGLLLDLGVSSHQFDEADRGFSYRFDARLDMRMDREAPLSAWNIVNEYSQADLAKLFWDYADERWSKRIAEFIVEARKKKPIDSTFELVELIKNAIPLSARKTGGHPAKRVFQAIRMKVNDELGRIDTVLRDVLPFLNVGGRIAVITFHSIEDGLVKRIFKEYEHPCICPADFPICKCGRKPILKTMKPVIVPSAEEMADNPRAKSAKLRTAELREQE